MFHTLIARIRLLLHLRRHPLTPDLLRPMGRATRPDWQTLPADIHARFAEKGLLP